MPVGHSINWNECYKNLELTLNKALYSEMDSLWQLETDIYSYVDWLTEWLHKISTFLVNVKAVIKREHYINNINCS